MQKGIFLKKYFKEYVEYSDIDELPDIIEYPTMEEIHSAYYTFLE
jgi:hypothetical protein